MTKRRAVLLIIIFLIITGAVAAYLVWFNSSPEPTATVSADKPISRPTTEEPVKPEEESYKGTVATTGNTFDVTVPNGWSASVSNSPSFLAIMFASPGHIAGLNYNSTSEPAVDYNGIASWSGLTEHFYIRAVSDPAQGFNPQNHQEVSSQSFTFDDGTVGKRYLVAKHSQEAAQWGGLLKDDVWYGRTYIYEKEGTRVEAHLAHYPSTDIDITFFEKVIKSLTLH